MDPEMEYAFLKFTFQLKFDNDPQNTLDIKTLIGKVYADFWSILNRCG